MAKTKTKTLIHFLVVDDDSGSRKTIIDFLRTMGYQKITVAENGAEAIRILNNDKSIEFIISDWDMPLMNGLELLHKVRSDSSRCDIPFLMVTSPISQEKEKITLAAEKSVDGYLIKPFRFQHFKDKIDILTGKETASTEMQVVLAEDDPDARETVIDYLKHFGFKKIKAFENGRSALEYVKKNYETVGVIISDWEMPDINGSEFLRACKSTENLSLIPFVMITSQSSMEYMKVMQAAKAQVDQYLLKPFSPNDLKDRIQGLVEKFHAKKKIKALLEQAEYYNTYGQYNRSKQCYEEILKIDPTHVKSIRELGKVVAKTAGTESAIPFYKEAVNLNPYSAQNHILLASALSSSGKVDEAINALTSAIGVVSFNADLHFHLGRLYYKQKKILEARVELEKALEIEMNHREASILLEMMGVFDKPAPKKKK